MTDGVAARFTTEVGSDQSATNIRRLQPLRVLLSGQDRRFIRVTAFLLALRGYDVTEAEPGEAVHAAARHRADVVVLESGLSRAVAASRVAQLGALAAAPGVVMVTDDGKNLWSGQPTVEKWTPLEQLVGAIESASLTRRLPAAEAASQ